MLGVGVLVVSLRAVELSRCACSQQTLTGMTFSGWACEVTGHTDCLCTSVQACSCHLCPFGCFVCHPLQVGFPDLAKAKGALQNVFKIVDRKSPIDPASAEGITLDSRAVRGELELQNVVFAYPARPTINVFNNFCLSIPAGEVFTPLGGPLSQPWPLGGKKPLRHNWCAVLTTTIKYSTLNMLHSLQQVKPWRWLVSPAAARARSSG